MEKLMEFLETYWGISIAGGVTVGSIITFIYVQVRYILKTNEKTKEIAELMGSVQSVVAVNNKDEIEKAELLAQNQYLQKVIATTFKAISYLTASSKLPIEEKLALQEEFINLKTAAVTTVKPLIKEIVEDVEDVYEENKNAVKEVLVTVADEAVDLISKYTKKEGV